MRKAFFPILSFLLLFGCASDTPKDAEKSSKAVPVIAKPAAVTTINLYYETTGELRPIRTLVIYPEVSEKITYIACKEGGFVKEGDLLFKLDPTSAGIRVNECLSDLSKAHANLKSQQNKITRYSKLQRRDAIAEIEWDDMEQAKQLYEAEKTAAEVRLRRAESDLNKTEIRAAFNGKIGRVHQSEHELSSPTKSLSSLSDFSKYTVEFYLAESEAADLIESGKRQVLISPLEDPENELKAELTFIDKCLHPQTKQVFAKAEISPPDDRLFSGQAVHVKILSKTLSDHIVISEKAVHSSSDGHYVYLIKEDHTVEKRAVKPLCYRDMQVVVESGLEGGELIVIEGHMRLFPGQLVEASTGGLHEK